MRPPVAATAIVLAGTVAMSACAVSGSPAEPSTTANGSSLEGPVRVAAVPVSPPAAALRHDTCGLLAHDTEIAVPQGGVVTVDPQPVGAVADWLPGLNQRPCRSQLTGLGQPAARRLAVAVNAGQAIEVGGVYNCPADDGSSVVLFFQFPGRVVETVSVELSGCGWITAPGRVGRFTPTAMEAELATLAPLPWRS